MNHSGGAAGGATVFRIGLTGGIATGKSVVASAFREDGAFVLDTDTLGHDLMKPGTEAYQEIRAAFGETMLSPDGRIDRKKLSARVFSDDDVRRRLNSILHPRILAEVEDRVREFARDSPGGIVVVQAALLVDAGARSRFHRIVVTHCDPEIQARRLRERDSIPAEEAMRRIASQAAPRERLEAADYLVDTSGSLEETRARAKEVFGALLREWEGRKASV